MRNPPAPNNLPFGIRVHAPNLMIPPSIFASSPQKASLVGDPRSLRLSAGFRAFSCVSLPFSKADCLKGMVTLRVPCAIFAPFSDKTRSILYPVGRRKCPEWVCVARPAGATFTTTVQYSTMLPTAHTLMSMGITPVHPFGTVIRWEAFQIGGRLLTKSSSAA